MRKIDPHNFKLGRRSTSRDINQRIALNLIREHQPVSRADLARRMRITRGAAGILVKGLIDEGLVYQGASGDAPRGRKPVFLYVETRKRLLVAVDARETSIDVMLCDFGGRQIALETLNPITSPTKFVERLAAHIRTLLKRHNAVGRCEAVGLVIPGMVDHDTGHIINAPPLGWRNVQIREPLSTAAGLPVYVESAAKACALAQMWTNPCKQRGMDNFVYVTVSDGVGTGVVIGGELIRGNNHIAGEFGHMAVSLDGPQCVCGAAGCWMAYISNIATISRYDVGYRRKTQREPHALTIADVIARARSGDVKAVEAIQVTARYLGLGLVTIIHGINPGRIYVGGEITAAWDIIEPMMRNAVAERTLTQAAANTPIEPSTMEHPRLWGAAALISAPTFAAPRLA